MPRPELTEGHQAILELLRSRRPEPGLLIPPPSMESMGGEYLVHDDARRTLTGRFPVREQYENPARAMQGGFIAAAIDNVLGPLCYLHTTPSVTLTFELSFIRPVMPDTPHVEVRAHITDLTRRYVHLQAEVARADGKLAVRAHSIFAVV